MTRPTATMIDADSAPDTVYAAIEAGGTKFVCALAHGALLELMARRGALCVLGAVDSQVCWEILSQLIDDSRVRPTDVVLSAQTLPEIFGETYRQLSALPVGGSCLLSDLTPLRKSFPSVLHTASGQPAPYRFRQVKIQRGALFEGLPASSTARRFQGMSEETPPWLLTLVPEPISIS